MAKARAITGLHAQAPTVQNARVILRERLHDLYAGTKNIDSVEYIQELHDLRIAAKRVRYTLEIFKEFLPIESQEYAQELTALQDELGALHDSEVMLALLSLALREQPDRPVEITRKPLLSADLSADVQAASQALSAGELEGLGRFLRRQEERREQCYAAFRLHWDRLEEHHFREKLLAMIENM